MTRVVYWNNIPAPYMVDRFNAVAARRNLEFEAWFSARTESDRSWAVEEARWQFPFRHLPALRSGTSALALPIPLLTGSVPNVLVSLYAGLDFLAGAAVARRRGARTAFWVEVTFDAWVRRRRWKEALKSRVLPRADGILTAGTDGRAYARRYGAQDERIHCVPHVINFDHYARGANAAAAHRDQLRQELGLRGVTFAYVGRIWTGKGLTYLLDAFEALQQHEVEEVSLLLVGDGKDEALLRARVREKALRNVVFTGFQTEDALPRFYAASDVFVFPTLGDPFGMVVLEAMACGLPVVSTTAAGEIGARVDEGLNGFLVPAADSDSLRERMTLLVRDDRLRRRMGEAAAHKVAGQTPELWADAFEHAVEAILAMPRVENGVRTRTHESAGTVAGRAR